MFTCKRCQAVSIIALCVRDVKLGTKCDFDRNLAELGIAAFSRSKLPQLKSCAKLFSAQLFCYVQT